MPVTYRAAMQAECECACGCGEFKTAESEVDNIDCPGRPTRPALRAALKRLGWQLHPTRCPFCVAHERQGLVTVRRALLGEGAL